MKRHVLPILLLICLIAPSLSGQEPSQAGAVANRDDILKLLEVMRVRDQMRTTLEQISNQVRAVSRDRLEKGGSQPSDEELAKLDGLQQRLFKEMPIDGILDDMVPVYQRHLTKEDVEALIHFYSTPTGQKILEKFPAIMVEAMEAGNARMQSYMQKVDKMVEEFIEEQLRKESPRPGRS